MKPIAGPQRRRISQWVRLDDRDYWVGRHKDMGVLVYDPRRGDGPSGSVNLFTPETRTILGCNRGILGQRSVWVRPDSAEAERAVEIYVEYLRIKDREHLEKLEAIARASSAPVVRDGRRARCWACKQPLDADESGKCLECGWIPCSCGACGCDYPRSRRRHSEGEVDTPG